MNKNPLCAVISALCILVLLGCQGTISRLRPPLEEEGEVYLYIQPYPQEAERLRFSIEGMSAVRGDGVEIPLEISLRDIKPGDLRRQRLLAYGRMPPGSYVGFSAKVKRATLKREDGEADLTVPDVPVRTDFSFTIVRKRAYVVSLTFHYRESISMGFSFSPVFSAFVPSKPIVSLSGFVTNKNSNNIMVFDKKLGQVAGVIATGRGPAGMALDQTVRRVYAAISGDDEIAVIDITGGEVINKIKLFAGDRPQELALTPDGRTLLVLNAGTNTVSFVDPFSLFELNRVKVGNGPRSILIDPSGKRGYVFNTLSGTISVLDLANRAIVTAFSTDPGPIRGQFNRRGDNLYVIHELSSYVTVVDPISFRILRRFSVGTGMISVKADDRTALIYIGRRNDTMVGVYNPLAFVSVDFIDTGGTIHYMAIDGEENNLYLVNLDRKSLMVSNLVRKKIVYEMDVGDAPYWVVIMGER